MQEMTIWFAVSPASRASAVDSSAEMTMHALMISSECRSSRRSVFSCILAITRSWFSDPPLTPIRTGLPASRAILQIVANCSSRRFPVPTFPGLIRYLASAPAHAG